MSKKVTKAEARKVLKALAEYKGQWILRQGEDAPFIPTREYMWNTYNENGAEIIWESGDYDWSIHFVDWMYERKQEFGLGANIHLQPYNSFVVSIYKW